MRHPGPDGRFAVGGHARRRLRLPLRTAERATLLLPVLLQVASPLAVGAIALAPQTAQAADPARPSPARPKVLLLRADLDKSGLSANQGLQLTKDLFAQASRYKQLDVVLSSLDLAEEMFEFECTDASAECLAKVGAKYAAQQVVYTHVEPAKSGGGLLLTMRVIDVAQARVAQTTSQPIESVDKSTIPLQKGLVVLLGPTDMPAEANEATGTVQITLFGGGVALVYVDGKLAGRTSVSGLKLALPAGPHTVKVVRAGFKDWSGSIAVKAGKTVEQAVTLEAQEPTGPAGATPAVVAQPLTHKWWFWTGIGVVAVGVGVLAAVLAGGDAAPTTGGASLGLGSGDASRDPVFGRTGP